MAGPDTAALFAAAINQFRSRDLDGAAVTIGQVLALDPADTRAHHFLSTIEFNRGNSPAALAAIRRSVELAPGNADYWLQYAAIARRAEDWPAVEMILRNALAAIPDASALHHAMGKFLQKRRRYAEAKDVFLRAVARWPADAVLLADAAAVMGEFGLWEDAYSLAARAIASNVDTASAHRAAGDALAALGRFDEAIVAYDTCGGLKSAPKDLVRYVGEARKDMAMFRALKPAVRRAGTLGCATSFAGLSASAVYHTSNCAVRTPIAERGFLELLMRVFPASCGAFGQY